MYELAVGLIQDGKAYVCSLSEEEIREFCRGQIAHYKIPRYIRFVEEYPMTITGKVQKFAMRDKMIEELNLNQAKTA